MAQSQIDREFNDRMLALAQTLSNGNGILQSAMREYTKKLIGAQGDVVQTYEEFLTSHRKWTSKEAQDKKAHLIKLKKLEESEQHIRQDYANNLKRILDDQIKLNKQAVDIRNKQASFAAGTKEYNKHQIELDRIDKKRAELKARKDEVKMNKEAGLAVVKQSNIERINLERNQLRKTAQLGDIIRTDFKSAAKSITSSLFGGATLTKSITEIATGIKDAFLIGIKTGGFGVGVMPEIAGGDKFNIWSMSMLGFNAAESVKVQAENRRTILSSMNGINTFVEGLEEARSAFLSNISDPTERSRIAIESFNIAVKSGIRMTKEQATMFAADIKRISRYTGEEASVFVKHIDDIMSSEEVQNQLRGAADEAQRKSILESVRMQYVHNRAMGMTAEQALRTSKALAALDTRRGKTVIGQSAKMQMMAGLLGMGSAGAELRTLEMLRGAKTPEQKLRYEEILQELRNRYDKMVFGRIEGYKMGFEEVAEKIGLDSVIGKEFNTNVVKAITPQEEAFKTIPEIPVAIREGIGVLHNIYSFLQKNMVGQAVIGLAGSASGMIETALGTLFGGGALYKLLGRGGAGAAAAGVGGAASGAAGAGAGTAAAAGAGGLTGGTIAAIVAAVAAAGTGIYSAVQFARGEDSSNWISNIFDSATGGWNMFEALDSAVGGPLSETNARLDELASIAKAQSIATEIPSVKTKLSPQLIKEEKEKEEEQKKLNANQLKQAELATEYLKTISDANKQQIELAEKQLVALTMTENERTGAGNRSNLLKDTRFSSSYGYVV